MELNRKIVSLLKRKKRSRCSESCTGGLLSNTIASVNGSSKVFSMGLVTSNKSKTNILNVPKKL